MEISLSYHIISYMKHCHSRIFMSFNQSYYYEVKRTAVQCKVYNVSEVFKVSPDKVFIKMKVTDNIKDIYRTYSGYIYIFTRIPQYYTW